MTLDSRFATGVREQLVDAAAGTGPLARLAHRRRIVLGLTSGVAGAALLTAGAILATGIPGGHIVTELDTTVSQSFTGSATVELGLRPADANAAAFTITCTSAGAFSVEFADGSADLWECSDTPGLNERTTIDPYDSTLAVGHVVTVREHALAPGETSFLVRTDPGTTWTISAGYANSVTTDWGVNANGQTYGTPNEKGFPDLISVQATNGAIGYSYTSDFEANGDEGDTFPVYEADGTTVIGEFFIGNGEVITGDGEVLIGIR